MQNEESVPNDLIPEDLSAQADAPPLAENGIQAAEEMIEPAEDSLEQTEAQASDLAPEQDLSKLLEDSRGKTDEYWDQLVRARAELDNIRRRHAKELENAHKYGLDKFVESLLGVWDSLELGHQAAHDENANLEKLIEGTELTLKMLSDVMEKFGVEPISPLGVPFDPDKHQAMSMQPSEKYPPNTVTAVIQKGYTLNGRLVRPALVMVSQSD